MGLFTTTELRVIDTLTAGKRLTDEDKERLPLIKEKLAVLHQAEIPERFRLLTGWTNRPKDYPA